MLHRHQTVFLRSKSPSKWNNLKNTTALWYTLPFMLSTVTKYSLLQQTSQRTVFQYNLRSLLESYVSETASLIQLQYLISFKELSRAKNWVKVEEKERRRRRRECRHHGYGQKKQEQSLQKFKVFSHLSFKKKLQFINSCVTKPHNHLQPLSMVSAYENSSKSSFCVLRWKWISLIPLPFISLLLLNTSPLNNSNRLKKNKIK